MEDTKPIAINEMEPEPSMENLENYLQLMCEGTSSKIYASGRLFELARTPENLLALSQNEAALDLLNRVVREEWQHNTKITLNLMSFFACISMIKPLGDIILHYEIDSLCLEIINNALWQYEKWEQELKLAKQNANLAAMCEDFASLSIQESEQSELDLRQTSALTPTVHGCFIQCLPRTSSHGNCNDQSLLPSPKECSLEEPHEESDAGILPKSQDDHHPPSPTFATNVEEDNLPLLQEATVWLKEQECNLEEQSEISFCGISPESHKEHHPPSPTNGIAVKKDKLRPRHELLKECKEVDSSLSDLSQDYAPIVLQDDQLPPPRKREAKVKGRKPTKKWNLGLPALTRARAPPPPPPTPLKPHDGKEASHSGLECSMEERMPCRKSNPLPAAYREQSRCPLLKPSPSLRDIQRKQEHRVKEKKSTRRPDSSLPPLSHSGPPRPSPPTAAKYLACSASRGMQVHKGRKLMTKSDTVAPKVSPTLPSELQFCRSPALMKHRERRLEERKPIRKSDPCKTIGLSRPLSKPRSTTRDTQHKEGKPKLGCSLPPLAQATMSFTKKDERSPSSELEVEQRKRALKPDSGLYDLQQRMTKKWVDEQCFQPQTVSSTIHKLEEKSLLPKDSEEELEPRVKPGKTDYKPPPQPQGPLHVMQETSCPFSKSVPQVERRKSTGPWDCKQQVPTGATSLTGSDYSSPLTVHEVIHTQDTSDSIEDTTSDQIYKRELDKKFDSLVKQQNNVLKVSFFLLLSLTESMNLEEQMAKKNIVGLLITFLDRNNTELLLVLLTFLNQLSQMRDNVNSMAKLNVVDKIQRLVSWPCVDVSYESLKLIKNLSFNGGLRAKMIDTGMITCLVKILASGDTRLHATVYSILYHLSLSNHAKAMFPDTGCIQIAMRQVVHRAQRGKTFALAAALLVNLALYEQNARIMCIFNYREGDPDLSALLGTVPERFADEIIKSKSDKDQGLVDLFICSAIEENPLTMKIVRNISHHEDLHHLFWEHIDSILNSCNTSKNEDYVAEGLACFGNIIISKLDHERLFRHYNVIGLFKSKLIPGSVADDVVLLEMLKILGTVAAESHKSTEFLCKEDLVRPFVRMLRDKREDEEFILILLYFIYQLLKHENSRKYVLEETDAAAFVYQLRRYGKNEKVSKACDAVFGIIVAYDEDWKAKVVVDELKHHNKKWLKMVGKPDDDATGAEDTSDFEDAASEYIIISEPEDPGLC